jgi:UDP-N-acetylmuramyl tripeptide synthase
MDIALILFAKIFSFLSKMFNLGNGSTWPGHIALSLKPSLINDILTKSQTQTIIVVGTNGKTTTTKLLETILKSNGKNVLLNSSGANLLNGIASSLLLNSSIAGKLSCDFAILELDENAFPKLIENLDPNYIVALNLFRDQLDRYGEINTIAKHWKTSMQKLSKAKLILNADDPQIAYLGKDTKLDTSYFGLNERFVETKTMPHAADSILCPNCGQALNFKGYYFSHLGIWECPDCKFRRPSNVFSSFSDYPLQGTYAKYDILAAVLTAREIGINDKQIVAALKEFKPAFGRQEEIVYKDKHVQLFLAKNPISFNQSLSTVKDLGAKTLLIILNDKIPDGLDVSWIWDVDFEQILDKNVNIIVSGLRAYDMAVRLKYAGFFVHIAQEIDEAINLSLQSLEKNEKLYILPNYSAMLTARKILTGKKIL